MDDDIPMWEEAGDLEGQYANCFRVGFNAFEFLIDAGQSDADGRRARTVNRVTTNPGSAKELCRTLQKTLEEYERAFGVIPEERD